MVKSFPASRGLSRRGKRVITTQVAVGHYTTGKLKITTLSIEYPHAPYISCAAQVFFFFFFQNKAGDVEAY